MSHCRSHLLRYALLSAAALYLLAGAPAQAQNEGSSSLHAGTVNMRSPEERQLFERLLCECGGCQRLPLSTCACSWAEDARARIRAQMDKGVTPEQIQAEYRETWGPQAISIPADEGLGRALWLVPLLLIALAAVQLFRLGRKWSARSRGQAQSSASSEPSSPASSDATPESRRYDEALERELSRLDDP